MKGKMKVSGALYRNPYNCCTHLLLLLHFLSFAGVSFYQYLEHIPVPYVEMNKCNSTEHYNGLLEDSHICSGARADRPTCKVKEFFILVINEFILVVSHILHILHFTCQFELIY